MECADRFKTCGREVVRRYERVAETVWSSALLGGGRQQSTKQTDAGTDCMIERKRDVRFAEVEE